jgi:hypothetical protein
MKLLEYFVLLIIFGITACNSHQKQEVFNNDLIPLKYNNPGLDVDLGVGLWAWPLPMDYDDDGDLDLVVSCPDKPFNGLYLFENSSTKQEKIAVLESPLKIGVGEKHLQVSFVNGQPRVLGRGVEYRNFKKVGFDDPVELYPKDTIEKEFKKIRFSQWKYVDYEGDGDLDLMVGIDEWGDYGWDNAFDAEGNWKNGPLHGYILLLENIDGKYTNQGKIKAGNSPIDIYGAPSPNMMDFDDDGDLDIICGEFLDRLTWFENTGTREKPVFAEGRFLENENGAIKMDLEMIVPVAIDWDGDRDVDLIVGDEDGRVAFIENTGTVKSEMPVFKSPVYIQQKADLLKFGALATPFSVDWDEDGDQDLICGNSAGYIGFIENLDGANPPKWNEPVYLKANGETIRIMAGDNGSIQGPAEKKWGYTTLSVADWDGDGLKDLIVNSIWGKVEWYKNIGQKGNPQLAKMGGVMVDWKGQQAPKPSWNWWSPQEDELVTQWRTTPNAMDWNKDGMMDLVMLDHEGYLAFFERFKKDGQLLLHPGKRIFKDADVEDGNGLLRLNEKEAGGSGRRKLCFADWDNDGDLDLIVNSTNVAWYENVAEKDGSVVFKNKGNLSEKVLAGHTTSPTTVDWDKNGKPELLIGAEDGHFYYFSNPNQK